MTCSPLTTEDETDVLDDIKAPEAIIWKNRGDSETTAKVPSCVPAQLQGSSAISSDCTVSDQTPRLVVFFSETLCAFDQVTITTTVNKKSFSNSGFKICVSTMIFVAIP